MGDTNNNRIGIFEYLRAVADSGLPRLQRDLLRTLMTWADAQTWELWPSARSIADAMGCDARTVRRAMRCLYELGLVECVGFAQGGTNRIRINTQGLLARGKTDNPHTLPPVQPTPGEADKRAPGGGPCVSQTHKEPASERTTQTPQPVGPAGVVISILGSQRLLSHPNATAERLEYIARIAPKKKNPAGWAASAIRDAYEPAPPSEDELKAERIRKRDAALNEFDELPHEIKCKVWDRACQRFPNLDPHGYEHRAVFKGALARVMMEETELRE